MQRLCLLALPLLIGSATSLASAQLHMQWQRQLPERKPAWEFTQRMPQDRAYVPAAAGEMVFVGCEHNGALLAFDAASGEEKWRFYTGGPIRAGAIADQQRVYVASDDGYLYCLNHDGQLQWKFRGGPRNRWVIGHERLISAWPASARPVLADGKLIYQAGYWPVDGVYLHALDPATGQRLWTNGSLDFRPFGELRVEGDNLNVYGHHGSGIFDVNSGIQTGKKPPKPDRPAELPETPGTKGHEYYKTTAGGRIFVSTSENFLYGFAKEEVEKPRVYDQTAPTVQDEYPLAADVLKLAEVSEGFCLVPGPVDARLIEGLVRNSNLNVVAVDGDARRVQDLRDRLDAAGVFDIHRLSVIHGDPSTVDLPPYFASLIIVPGELAASENIERALRPFGGKLVRMAKGDPAVTERSGPPAGSDNWAQEFHDAANTLASRDKLVKAPLGLLWYGGPAAHARFYYDGNVDHQSGHGLNPQPVSAEVIDGRMILQGPGLLGAIDIYTGRVMWETELPEVYTFGGGGGGLGKHSKKHPRPWEYPAALEAEVIATHRCRASGFNMVSTREGIYVAVDQHILRVRPSDGEVIARWEMPEKIAGDQSLCWGGIRETDGVIIATLFRPQDLIDAQAGHDGNGGDWAGDRMPMKYLAALDGETGKLLWHREATWSYINRSGICAGGGKVFAVDLMTDGVMAKLEEAGRKLPGAKPALLALDLKTGQPLWQFDLDVYVQNIAYSPERDWVLVPNRRLTVWEDGLWVDKSSDARRGKSDKNRPGLMRVLSAQDGKPAWEVDESPYHTPIIVLDDLLIDRYGTSYNLTDGQRNQRVNPLTGQAEEWNFRKGGCNHLVACDNLVTWRCAFYDLGGGSGAMKLAGMDAGCTPTLLPAGGVLNIPNFGTHHKRNRMTAMALVHRPDNELWTKFAEKPPSEPKAIVRGGYNFGAPGDRVDDEGTVWLAVHPRKREDVRYEPSELTWYQGGLSSSFVTSSGVEGAAEIRVPVMFGGKPKDNGTKRPYLVRLHFAEPQPNQPGERVFTVQLEGQPAVKDLDIVEAAGGSGKPLVKEIEIEVTDALDITLSATAGEPLLSGVELIAK